MLLGAWITGNVGTKPRAAQHSEGRGRCKFSAVGEPKATVLQVFQALGALPSLALPSTVESLSCGAIMDPAVGDPWAPVGERVPDLSSSKATSDWWSPLQPHRPVHLYTLGSSAAVPTMEGPLRRKTLLKEGRKPAVSAEAHLSRGGMGSREGMGSRDRPTGVPVQLCH